MRTQRQWQAWQKGLLFLALSMLVTAGVVSVCLLAVRAYTSLQMPTRIEALLARHLGNPGLILGSQLKAWKSSLGEPNVVEQGDEGHTYFYWPGHGVAVFCHPHFERQFYRSLQDDWVITTITIPLQGEINAMSPPCAPNTKIRFAKLVPAGGMMDTVKGESNVELSDQQTSIKISRPYSILDTYD